MSLILRLVVIALGFAAACLVDGIVVVFGILFPDMIMSDMGSSDAEGLIVIVGIGAIYVAGFSLLPMLVGVAVAETFAIRHVLVYATCGGLTGGTCCLLFVTPAEMFFRQLEVITGAGILGGVVYWMIAGRNAGVWRARPVSPSR